jgi:mono/diheme cytochrome c family protein
MKHDTADGTGISRPLFASIVSAGLVLASGASAMATGDVARGKEIWLRECAVCHGETGGGDGPAAELCDPRPRNFDKGMFKFRTTENGELPTDADVERTLRIGIMTTAMPSFVHLGEPAIADLLAFIKTLGYPEGETRSWFEIYEAPPPIEVPPPPVFDAATVEKGKELYVTMGCNTCHGKLGRGDGKKPEEMLDDWGYPLNPRDFALGLYKGGGKPDQLYTRVMTGLNGTPMTGYWKDAMTPDERWAIVAFVLSIGTPRNIEHPSHGTIEMAEGVLPAGIDDAKWQAVPASAVPRMPMNSGWSAYFAPVPVRVAYADGKLAVRVEWDEAENSCPSARIVFPTKGRAPTFTIGSPEQPVAEWVWDLKEGASVAQSDGTQPKTVEGQKIEAASRVAGGKRVLVVSGEMTPKPEQMLVMISGCNAKGPYRTTSTFADLKLAAQ